MSWWGWALVAAGCWITAGALIAVLFGRMARDRRRAEAEEAVDMAVWSMARWRELDRLEAADK